MSGFSVERVWNVLAGARFLQVDPEQVTEEAIAPIMNADATDIITAVAVLTAAAALAFLLAWRALVPALRAISAESDVRWIAVIADNGIARRASLLASIVVIAAGWGAIPNLSSGVEEAIGKAVGVMFIVTTASVITATLGRLREVELVDATDEGQPVRARLQIANLVVYLVAGAFVATVVTDQSLWYLITGLGAVAALLAIVFQHTILSTIASMQITQSDMIRVGDWIEVPERRVNGIVIDVALHTVKVRNWDNTILSVPTHTLLSESYQNWRGMWEAGIRRMQRALLLDASSIRYMSEYDLERLRRYAPLDDFVNEHRRRWQANSDLNDDLSRAERRITNLTLFREYLRAYLERHGQFADGESAPIVRQLAPTAQGIPLELYAFGRTTKWTEIERLQAEVVEHALAIAGEFGLRIYQQPADSTVRELNATFAKNLIARSELPSVNHRN